MNPQLKSTVDFNFYNIQEDQFGCILARVTTTVVNTHVKQNFTIQEIYNHVEFEDGDITNLHVPNLILIC